MRWSRWIMHERFTPSGVRLRRRHQAPGTLTWLLLPGGPGLGSESLYELADAMQVPGEIWMVDLPGDGSNPSASPAPFATWPHVLLEALDGFASAIYVGHSTGGMYLLTVPELESRLAGLALVSSAPDAGWRAAFAAMTQRHPLPAVERAALAYEADKTNERLRELAVASAEWNFAPSAVEQGRDLLRRMPYNLDAVEWSARAFDDVYASTWWPRTLPALIVSGADDRIVDQSLWQRPAFAGANVLHRTIAGAAHFPWIEQPAAVAAAFAELAARILSSNPHDRSGYEASCS
jgi:pimeloyl-ACP methyl ester carboxylesterase